MKANRFLPMSYSENRGPFDHVHAGSVGKRPAGFGWGDGHPVHSFVRLGNSDDSSLLHPKLPVCRGFAEQDVLHINECATSEAPMLTVIVSNSDERQPSAMATMRRLQFRTFYVLALTGAVFVLPHRYRYFDKKGD